MQLGTRWNPYKITFNLILSPSHKNRDFCDETDFNAQLVVEEK